MIIRQSFTGNNYWIVEDDKGRRLAMFTDNADAQLFVQAKSK